MLVRWLALGFVGMVVVIVLMVTGLIKIPTQIQEMETVDRASDVHVDLSNRSSRFNRIDGATWEEGKRYLLQHQNDPQENGIYQFKNGQLHRAKTQTPWVRVTAGTYQGQVMLQKMGQSTTKLRVDALDTDSVQAQQVAGTVTTAEQPNITALGPLTTALDLNNQRLKNVPLPNGFTDVTNQSYVDNYAQGMHIRAPVHTCTVSALPGTPTYDNGTSGVGATLTASSGALGTINGYSSWVNGTTRILVKDQADAAQNGVYVVTQSSAPYVLTRADDFDGSPVHELKVGSAVLIEGGFESGCRYVLSTLQTSLTNPPNVVAGVDDMTWLKFALASEYVPSWLSLYEGSTPQEGNCYVEYQTSQQSSHNMFTYDAATGYFTVLQNGKYRIDCHVVFYDYTDSSLGTFELKNATDEVAVVDDTIQIFSTNHYEMASAHFKRAADLETGKNYGIFINMGAGGGRFVASQAFIERCSA